MMCDVMPTISEDNISQRSSQFSGDDANFEQLMVSMLDERDKLMDSLREAQERLNESEIKLSDTEKERDSLQRQINANLPQVRVFSSTFCKRLNWSAYFFFFLVMNCKRMTLNGSICSLRNIFAISSSLMSIFLLWQATTFWGRYHFRFLLLFSK